MRPVKSKKPLSLALAFATLLGLLSVGSYSASYSDVQSSRWSAEDISYATEQGYMNGVGDGKFNPEGGMERAMIVTVLYRMEGEPEIEYFEKFKDVPDGEYYSKAVIWASRNEITNGTTSSTFDPYDQLTREQMAAFFARYAETKYINTDLGADVKSYSDYGQINDYAVAPLAWAKRYGIINGDTDTTLSPKKTATREQFAAILHRFDKAEFGVNDYRLAYNEPIVHSEYVEKEYPLVTDADFYVAVDGSDSADGSFDRPFATFARAKEAVRELKKTAEKEIKVAFKAGNYGELDNISFTEEDSGTSKVPITYCAYGDGDVTFSNGVVIPADKFKPIEESDKYLFNERNYSSIYKADLSEKADEISDISALFSGTGICHEARYPNKNSDGSDDFFADQTTTRDPFASIELQASLPRVVAKFRTVEGMKVTGHLRTGWLIDTFPVKSYDYDTHVLTFDFENWTPSNGYPLTEEGSGGYPLMYEGRAPDTVFFSNLSDQLDDDGEYWFDKKTNQLYVYKPSGDYTIAVGGSFMTIDEADYLSFVGIDFNGSTAKAITATSADNLKFDRCTMSNIAGSVVIEVNRCSSFNLQSCELYKFGDTGVRVEAREKSKRRELVSQNIVIDNNYFHDFGLIESWSEGISLDNAYEAKVSHNYFKNGAHAAIRYDNCIDTLIEYNVFDNMMWTTADYGAVYTWESVTYRSNKIRYNLFKNIRAKDGQYGIYLDDNSCGQEVYGNLFYNAGSTTITFNGGRDNEVHDNVVIAANGFGGNFVMYNDGVYGYIKDGNASEFGPGDSVYDRLQGQLPREGDPYYDEWVKRWPQLFRYNFDPDKVGERDCIFTTVNYIENNIMIGVDLDDCGEIYDMFAVGKETNRKVSLDENNLFKDPTHGDYTFKDNVDFPNIPIDKIGRY